MREMLISWLKNIRRSLKMPIFFKKNTKSNHVTWRGFMVWSPIYTLIDINSKDRMWRIKSLNWSVFWIITTLKLSWNSSKNLERYQDEIGIKLNKKVFSFLWNKVWGLYQMRSLHFSYPLSLFRIQVYVGIFGKFWKLSL